MGESGLSTLMPLLQRTKCQLRCSDGKNFVRVDILYYSFFAAAPSGLSLDCFETFSASIEIRRTPLFDASARHGRLTCDPATTTAHPHDLLPRTVVEGR